MHSAENIGPQAYFEPVKTSIQIQKRDENAPAIAICLVYPPRPRQRPIYIKAGKQVGMWPKHGIRVIIIKRAHSSNPTIHP